MKAINISSKRELAAHVTVACNILKRMKGLLGRSEFNVGEGIWLRPCNSIHTFFMRFPIDVVLLDRKNQVIALKRGLSPYRLTPIYLQAASVLELPEGVIYATSTRVGDEIEFL